MNSTDQTEPISIAELERLMRQGAGRAVVRLKRCADCVPYRKTILHACVTDYSPDFHCEVCRGPYMCQVVLATRDEAYYLSAIAARITARVPGDDHYQMAEILRRFAQRGDGAAREALVEGFELYATLGDFEMADQIVALDGAAGAIAVIELFETHAGDRCGGASDRLYMEMEEQFGAEPAASAMGEAAAANPRVAAFWQRVCAERETRPQHTSNRGAPIAYDTIREAIKSGKRPAILGGWGRKAANAELILAAQDLNEALETEEILAYLRIFRLRAFPLGPERLIRLTSHRDRRIRHGAVAALERVQSPAVRTLALRMLRTRRWRGHAPALLALNYRSGDESRLLAMAGEDMDADVYHSFEISARQLFKAHPELDCRPVMLVLYERGTCSLCRHGVVELMQRERPLPDWLAEEYRYDCYGGDLVT
ncbi:MAG TPA: hypothetical protein VKT77_05755 [Chthonomonadaceae bacterium]|nr:hypothetical protein [Chthonomonadaceae bacterium]